MKKSLAILSLAVMGLALPAHAALTVVYSADFNSPTYSDAALIGQDGWAITGTSVVNPVAVANTGTDGNVTLATTGQDVNRTFAAANSGSVFLSADITVTSAPTTGGYFLHLGDGGTSNFFARLYVQASPNPGFFNMALTTSSGSVASYGGDVALNTTQMVLMRYDFIDGAGNDTGALFLNPTSPDGSSDTPYIAALTTGTDAASISSVNLRQGSSSSAPTVVIDNLAIAVVPEPSVALLGLLGGLGLLRRRRA